MAAVMGFNWLGSSRIIHPHFLEGEPEKVSERQERRAGHELRVPLVRQDLPDTRTERTRD
jgi:hypothetical protein